MYVHPEHVRKGIGSALWRSASNLLSNKMPITVNVADYTQAVSFYRRLGFKETHRRTEICMTADCRVKVPLINLKLERSSG